MVGAESIAGAAAALRPCMLQRDRHQVLLKAVLALGRRFCETLGEERPS